MNNWSTVKLNQLGDFRNGANYPKGSYGKGDKIVNVKDLFKGRYINFNNLVELKKGALKNKSLYLTQHGDLLFTRSSLVKSGAGMVAMVYEPVEDILFCGFIIRYRVKQELVNPLFLLYLLRSPMYRKLFTDGSVQTNISNINQETLGNIEVYLPDIDEQNKITNILNNLDAKIEINNKINRELEAMAKTLYDYWFVRFDFPNEQGKPYKSSGGKMVYNEDLKRKIPQGWEVKTINSIIDVKDGTHDSPKPKEKGFSLITSKNLLVGGLDFENANLISEEDYNNINKRSRVETGDILFSMIGSIGVVYKVEEIEINFAIKNVALYKTSQKQSYKNYIYQSLKSYDMKRYMGNVTSGSIQKFIGLGSLRNMPILFNEYAIHKFENKSKQIFLKLENNKQQNQQLTALRDWLLPMLMNGQVTVKETEEKLSMVAEPKVEYKRV